MRKFVLLVFLVISAAAYCPASASDGPELYELPNGFRIVYDRIPGSGVVSFGIWTGTGSVHEKDEQAGIAHMLEHMLFKGSKNYPVGAAERTVESLGGRMNGATSFEYTCYFLSIPSQHFREAFKVLADMVKNPLLCTDEFESERMVVLREVDQREDDPVQRSARMFYQAAYPGAYYGRPIIGFRDTIAGLTIEDIKIFHEVNYIPNNMTLIAAGDVPEETVLKLAMKSFGHMKSSEKPSPVPPETIPGEGDVVEFADIKSVYLWTGREGPRISAGEVDRAAALSLAMNILGGGRGSRLYRRLREDSNIVNAVSAGFSFLPRGGPVYIRAEFEPEEKERVLKEIREELEEFIETGPLPDEIERARTLAMTDIIYGFESSAGRMRAYGNYAASDNMDFFLEYRDALERRSAEDIIRAVKKYLVPEEFSSAKLLPRAEGER